jgi:hypothetical protein
MRPAARYLRLPARRFETAEYTIEISPAGRPPILMAVPVHRNGRPPAQAGRWRAPAQQEIRCARTGERLALHFRELPSRLLDFGGDLPAQNLRLQVAPPQGGNSRRKIVASNLRADVPNQGTKRDSSLRFGMTTWGRGGATEEDSSLRSNPDVRAPSEPSRVRNPCRLPRGRFSTFTLFRHFHDNRILLPGYELSGPLAVWHKSRDQRSAST